MIIVTGGAGFIGSNIVAALEERGLDRIVVCDTFGDTVKWQNLVKHDLYNCIDSSQLLTYLEAQKAQVRVIFHMGAISSTTEKDVDLILNQNYRLTMNLVQWCGRNRVRLIYASSAATYGDGSAGFVDDFTRKSLSKLRPLNPYGWSKHMVDRTIAQIRELGSNDDYALPPQYAGLKFFNVYGPNEYHKGGMMSVVNQVYHQILEKGKARLFKSDHPDYPDGGQLRDFIYINDCLDVMMWLYDHPEVSGLFNVGTGKARSFADLARATFAAMGKPENLEFFEMPDVLKGKYQYFTESVNGGLEAAGYTGKFTSLEEGVRDYVQTYLMKDDPYR
jgi:ADP-L-glycero-D-manno-heptose 6-epimerase